MYTKIVPAIQRFDVELKVPKVYLADTEEGIMIMENLKTQGFYMGDKVNGTYLEHPNK